ncbi:hypothetical protein GIB67_019686 [Kingdonia uniflora]|uniref:Non-specific lipid-transfer protein n=1 Tax=Kingdonia uniflora TaxID=39325 RepID=A0A7J7MK51_9MAGN|nr:hypothetical protein GIB67_019686 [Kingdonia uniflora]
MKTSVVAISTMSVLALLLLLHLPSSEAAIACSDVVKNLTPCVKYLINGVGAPPANCCAGASKLASAATSTADKKAACECIKTAAQKINPNVAAAKALPRNCGISLPFTVSTSVDCSK